MPTHRIGDFTQTRYTTEKVAAECEHQTIYLYSHKLMTENIALYERLGYVEFARRAEFGFRRVYMRKAILISRQLNNDNCWKSVCFMQGVT